MAEIASLAISALLVLLLSKRFIYLSLCLTIRKSLNMSNHTNDSTSIVFIASADIPDSNQLHELSSLTKRYRSKNSN